MPIFNTIITLSKRTAASLLRDEQPKDLLDSEIFNTEDKQYILDNLTKDELIKQRLQLSNQINKKEDWNLIRGKIKTPVSKLVVWRYAAAAVVVGLLATAYIFKDNLFNNQQIVPTVVNTIEAGTDKATLTLESGQEVALQKGTSYQSNNATSNGEEIVYNSLNEGKEIAYNYLTIPRGGQFSIKLSDGTKVWLNSESKLRYPVSFIDGQPRQVELIYGEAYFDVSPSAEHAGASFKVIHAAQEVEVLGTEFNIKAYQDETNVYTTLVEGKVKVTYPNGQQMMTPGYQTNLNTLDNTMELSQVNVYNEVSWKDGIFSFKDKPLNEIMKVLSRWYDMEVKFENPESEKFKFNGVLGKDQNIEQILSTIQAFGAIQEYQINNKQVILN